MAQTRLSNVAFSSTTAEVPHAQRETLGHVRLVYRLLEPRMVFDAAAAATLAATHDAVVDPAHSSAAAPATAVDPATALVAALAAKIPLAPVDTAPTQQNAIDAGTPNTAALAAGGAVTPHVAIDYMTPNDAALAASGGAPTAHIAIDYSRPDGLTPKDTTVDLGSAAVLIGNTPGASTAISVVFVDPRVTDYQTIIQHIAPGTEVVVLNAETDGLAQIATYLAGHTHDITSIHILSHGAAGELELGGTLLTGDTLLAHQADLTAIGHALKAGGDILIYGCDVGAGTAGQQFVQELSHLTGDDVAASVDVTGAAALGGNWVLERTTGTIEAHAIQATDYAGLLALTAVDDTNTIAANATVAVAGNVLTNDSGTGAKTVTEVHGRAASVGVAYATSYGTITMNADGTYLYLVDAANSTVHGLIAGQSATDIIAYTAKDGSTANPDYGYLTITINGINDPPVAYDNVNAVTPTSAPTATGNLITDTATGNPADYIDRPQQVFKWTSQYGNNFNALGTLSGGVYAGTTTTVGTGVNAVNVTVAGTDPSSVDVAGTNGVTTTATQGGKAGYLQLYISPGGHTTGNATTGFNYTAPTTSLSFSKAVPNLEFTLTDVDTSRVIGGAATSTWIDQVTVTGTRNGVPVTYHVQYSGWDAQNGNSFYGNNYGVNSTDANGNIHIVFDGPVDKVTIAYNDGPTATGYKTGTFGAHLVGISDLTWQSAGGEKITQITANGTAAAVGAAGATVPATYGTITVLPDGSYTYNVDPNNAAVKALGPGATLIDIVPYMVTDSNGLTANAVLHVTVNGINDAPAGTDNIVTLAEDTTYTFSAASFGFSDPVDQLANTLQSVVITTLPPATDGVLMLNGVAVTAGQDIPAAQLGLLTFAAAANKNGAGIGSFSFQVRDNGGTANGGVDLDPTPNLFKFNITPVDDAPVTAVPATQTIGEDTQLTFSAANGNAITIADVDASTTGKETVTLSVANGTLILGATTGLTGLAGNGTGSITFTGTLAQVNTAIAGLKYQGNLNYNGADTLTIAVVDDGSDNGVAAANGAQSALVKTVAINVTPVNDPPIAVNDTATANEDTALTLTAASLLANDTDVDVGDTKTLVSVQSPVNGTVTLVGGNPVFTPNANFVGTASFTYTMKDTAGLTSTATVSITVNPVNDAPFGADKTATIAEDAPYTFSAADFPITDPSDTPANGLQAIVVTTLPAATDGVLKFNGVVVTAGDVIPAGQLGNLTFTPAADKNGTSLGAFTFKVQDNGGTANGGIDTSAAASTFKFNVTAVADIIPDVVAALEDTPITFNVLTGAGGAAADNFEGTPQVTSITPPVNGTVAFAADGTMTFTPSANFNGTTTFTYTVTSGGVTETATVTMNVAPINDAPVSAVPVAQTVAEDTQLVFSSANGNAITVSDIDAGASGTETVTLSAAHGTLILGSTTGLTGLAGNGTGAVTFTGTVAQVNAAIAGLKYQGVLNYNGGDTLTIAVTDDGKDNGASTTNGAQSSAIKTVAINVTPVNDPPVAVNDTVAATEDTPITIPATTLIANDVDVDGDALTIASVQSPTNGTVTLVGGNPVFTPAPNYFGPASFTYTVSDGHGGTSTATVNLTIAPVNDAPVTVNDSYTTTEKATLTVPVATGLLVNDTDVDTAHAALFVTQINGNAMTSGAPITLPSGAILTQNADGTFAYNPNGAFNSLAAGQSTTDSFTYQVSDGQGGLATATATVTITGVNDAPVAVADTNSTNPHIIVASDAAHGVLVNDTDADTTHASLVVSAVGGSNSNVGQPIAGSNGGTFTINTDGSYSFNPGTAFDSLPAGSSATSSITYAVSDGQGGFATTTLTVSVPYQNLPPYVANPPLAQVSQDGNTISLPLANIFSDPNPADQGNLTITASGLPPGLSVDATGTIVGTLTSDASQHAGPYAVTVTATDPSGSQISTTFNFSVGNPAPVAVTDTNTVGEHATTTGNVVTNDHDGSTDHDPLTVTQINGAAYTAASVITLASGAQLVMAADGTYSYDPHSAFNGLAAGQTASDSFTYQVSDGQGGFATATASITITGQNDAPVVVDPAHPGTPPTDPNHIIPAQIGQDGTSIAPLAVKSFFKDPDNGDTLTLSVTGTLPAGITFDPATGTFSGTPGAAASQGGPANNGTYSVLVNADDGHGGVVSTTVTFTISNPPPVALNDSNTVSEHGTTSGNVVANDHDGGGDTDPLAVTVVNGQTLVPGATLTLPSGAHLVMQANGAYSYDPSGAFAALAASQTATDTFTYVITDGQGGTATATATIIIQGQNDAPVATSDGNTTNPQVPLSVDAAHGVLANDTDAEHDALTVTTITNGSTTVAAGAAIGGTNGGSFTINADGSYAFDPGHAFDGLAPGASAQTSVTYAISDGHGGTSSTTLTITVPFTNLPPIVQQPIATQNGLDGAPVSIPVGGVFADPNPGDVLTVSATGLPPGLSYNPVSGAIEGTLTPDASQHGGQPYTVVLTATDPSGSTITSTFTFNVANPVPVAANDTNTVTEHGTTAGAVLVNDHDGGLDTDTLTVAQINGQAYTPGGTVTLPSGGLLVMAANGTYSYDPNGHFNGLSVGQTATDTFTYQVSDGQGGVATATVTITIAGQNEQPVVVDPAHPATPPADPNHIVPAQTGQDGSALIPLNVTSYFADPDTADSLTLSVPAAQLPPGVTFNPATGTFSGTPTSVASQGGNAGPGIYDVTVTANDGHGGTVSTVVRFSITDPAPVASDDSNTVAEHGTITGAASVLANDHDGGADTDPLSVSQVNGVAVTSGATIVLPSGALLAMNANGTYDYNPNGAFASLQVGQSTTDSFVYQVSDGQGGFATARVTIVINGQNDSPVANVDTNAIVAGDQLAVVAPLGVLVNDTDPEHDPLAVTGITNGTLSVAPGAAIAGSNGGTFVINADGSYTFDTGHAFDSLLPGTQAITSVTYTIADGHGGTSTTTLTITVPFADLPPVVNQPLPAQSSNDGSPVTIDVSTVFKDPNPGDVLSVTANGLPPGLSLVNGQIVGTLTSDASQHTGPYVVTLTATDPAGHTVTSTSNFTVGNPPPVAGNDTIAVTEHGTITNATVTGNDHDGGTDHDPLTVAQINGAGFTPGATIALPSGATLVMQTDGTYAYNPNGAFNGLALGQTASDSFTYQISDGQGGTATATVAITITGENDVPIVLDPAHPGVPVTPGTQVIPTQPVLDGSPITPLTVTSFFGDPDKIDTLVLSVNPAQLPVGITFDPATGTFSGTADPSASQGGPSGNGTYPIVVTASDGHGGTVSTVVVFQIGNPAPVAVADSNSALEHGTTTGSVLANDHDGGADTDPLHVTQVNGQALVPGAPLTLPSGALLVMNADGTYSYDPNGKFSGLGQGQTATDSFTYQVSDGQGGFATATATITITGQNDAPVVVDPAHPGTPPADPMHVVPAQTGSDGAAMTPLSVASYFKDPDTGDTLTLSVPAATLPPGITFDPATGTFSGTPTALASQGGPNSDGTYAVTVTATDSHGATVTTIVTFSVLNVPPVANPDTNSVQEHGTTSGTVLANDHDGGADTDPLTVSQVNDAVYAPGASIALPSGATLVMAANGTYSYDPNGHFNGLGLGQSATDTFTYQVSDGNGGVATTTVTITIAGQNDAPLVVDPATGTPVAPGASIVPAQPAQDGTALTPLSVSNFFKDPDSGDTLALSVPASTLPPGVTFDPATGTFSGTPTSAASRGGPASNGIYPVTITATDSHGATVTTVVTFTIGNPPPVATADAMAVPADQTGSGAVLANDHDGGSDTDPLTVTQVNGVAINATGPTTVNLPSGAILTINPHGTYAYNPNGLGATLGHGQQATDSFTYQVSDGQGGFDMATVSITVNAANAPPVVVDPANPGTPPADPLHVVPPQTGSDGSAITPLSVATYFADPNTGDVLTFSVPTGSLPPGITFDPATGTFAGTPGAAASQGGPAGNGTYPIVVTADDGYGGTTSTVVTLSIGNVSPVAANDAATVAVHGATGAGNVLINDHDGGSDSDPLHVSQVNGQALVPGAAVSLPSGALLVMNADGSYTYDPNGTHPGLGFGQTATDSFTYQVSDGNGGLATATVNITVTGINDPPVIIDPAHPGTPPADPLHVVPTQSGADGSPISPLNVTSYFTDPNTGDTLVLSVNPAQLPVGITFDPATGTFSGTADPSASQGGPSGNGTYPIVVTASDGHGGTVSTVVVFQIGNPAPVAVADSNSALEHGTTTGSVLANDHDGGADTDPLHVTQVNGQALVPGAPLTLPSGALLVMNADGTYSYDPNGKFSGLGQGQTATDSFTYQVSDGQGGFATATATITITGQNDAPVVVDPAHPGTPPADPMHVVPAQTGSDGAAMTPLSVASYFKDPDTGDTLTLSVPAATLPPGITFDPATGTFSGTPTALASQGGPNSDGTYAVTVTATDSHGATVTTIVTFSVLNVPPVANPDTNSVQEHGTTSGTVLANDHDGGADTDPLTVSQVNGSAAGLGHPITLPSGAVLTLNADGTYVYNPNGVFQSLSVGQTATDSFTYQISDGQGGLATATVAITLVGENDAPVVIDPTHPGQPPSDPNHVVPPVVGQDGNAIASLSVATVFHDPDSGDVLTLSVDPAALPPGITFDPATGTFKGVPGATASQGGPNGNGVYNVIVTADDGHGGTVKTSVTFTFTNVPPVAVDDFAVTQPGDAVRIPVLSNDHDGGNDTDPLTVIAATPSTGSVTINPDGSLNFVPAPGFVGLATITYTISDGQGGTSTAVAHVLVTPNIHPTAPPTDVPLSFDPKLPGNTGITADGAVLSAVHGFDPLNASAPDNSNRTGITASGVVVATANGISPLGGHGAAAGGASVDPRILNPVWRLQQMIHQDFGHPQDLWNPEGLTGFSLRYTFASDLDQGGKAQIVMDSMVRDRTLIVNLSSTELANHAHVVEYKVLQANGQPLPGWLDRAGSQVLIGERPVDVEAIRLRVIAVLSDGTTVERDVEIQTMSGEIKPIVLKQTDAAPLFSDQLRAQTQREDTNIQELLRALGR